MKIPQTQLWSEGGKFAIQIGINGKIEKLTRYAGTRYIVDFAVRIVVHTSHVSKLWSWNSQPALLLNGTQNCDTR